MSDNKKVYPHYFKELPAGTTHVDVYLLLDLYKVHNAAVAHAVKKLLCSGQRGAKDQRQDLVEARDSIQRALNIIDGPKMLHIPVNTPVDTSTVYIAIRNKLSKNKSPLCMTREQYAALSKFCVFRFGDARVDSGVSLFDRPVVFVDTLLDCSPVICAICNEL